MVIINPGSENKGGTLEQAQKWAALFLEDIHNKGILDVEMKYVGRQDDGDYIFHFMHKVTKKVAVLETHGFSEDDVKNFIFSPRQYWNGSSTANPCIEDFLEHGWGYKIEYYKK